jgi:CRISPR-associated protein Cmr6
MANKVSKTTGHETRWVLPLYRKLGFEGMPDWLKDKTGAHPGLLFDKFSYFWGKKSEDGQVIWQGNWADKQMGSAKFQYFKKFVASYEKQKPLLKPLLAAHNERLSYLFAQLKASTLEVTAQWRFVSGLGMAHPSETGFAFDRVVGAPYLPGSSVKGLARAWAEHWEEADPNTRGRVFGSENKDPTSPKKAGSVIFFDAYPLGWPKLEMDVINVHYKDYYEGKKDRNHQPIPPADYLSPTPIFFLTVAAGSLFRFAVARRPGTKLTDVDQAKAWLKEALLNLGAGAKTSVGYGHFE